MTCHCQNVQNLVRKVSHLDGAVSFGADAADFGVEPLWMRGFDVSQEGGVSDGFTAADEAEVGVGGTRTSIGVTTHLTLDHPAQLRLDDWRREEEGMEYR